MVIEKLISDIVTRHTIHALLIYSNDQLKPYLLGELHIQQRNNTHGCMIKCITTFSKKTGLPNRGRHADINCTYLHNTHGRKSQDHC